MKTVSEILKLKGSEVFSVSPDSSVYDALRIMADKQIGALLVVDEGEVSGIMSERDYARKVILQGKLSKDTLVREIMSARVLFVTKEQSTEDCMALMINKRIRHLPVFENERLAGLISIGDVVKAVIDEKEFTIDQLVNYITGKPTLK
ncbi:MAG TPA: CBS domain-containing protein [Ignavibacteriaceae bacterium]|nr:CBS domain-containing protein [Ignavibacteriaceae bacterium]